MFPLTETRLRTMFRRSIDAAIDFATLGEYGYAPAWETEDDGAVSTRADRRAEDAHGWTWPEADALDSGLAGAPSRRATGSGRAPVLLTPASAAGRARGNAQRRAQPPCAGQPIRGRWLPAQLPRVARQRDGMAPREQHCLADTEPGASLGGGR